LHRDYIDSSRFDSSEAFRRGRLGGKGGKLGFVTTADHLSLMVGNATNG
jgi:hypothetical protein